VHLSTDYVFAGDATSPYAEDAPLAPRSAYGRTKAAGEWAVRAECPAAVIVRTAWLYGPGGNNFPRTMARLAGERDTISVVADQHGQPTCTLDLARYLLALVEADAPPGAYHGTSEGQTSWHEFAQAVFESLGHDPQRVRPITTADYPLPAPRPAYSVLGHERTDAVGVPRLPHWRTASGRQPPAPSWRADERLPSRSSCPGLVSVVVLNYKGADDTITCLRSSRRTRLARHSDSSSSASTTPPATARLAADHRPPAPTCACVDSGANLGFAGGCNFGVALARGEFVALHQQRRASASWVGSRGGRRL
jgi:hypothetical protein